MLSQLTLALSVAAVSAQLNVGDLHKTGLQYQNSGTRYCLHSSDCGPNQYCFNFAGLFPWLLKQNVYDCHGKVNCVNDDGTFNKGGACCTSDADCDGDSYCMDYQKKPQTKAYVCKDKCRDKLCEEQLLHEIDESVKNMTEASAYAETIMKRANETAAELSSDFGPNRYCLKYSDCGKGQYCRNFFPWNLKNVYDCHGEKNCIDEDGNFANGGACCRGDYDCKEDSYCMNYKLPQTKAYKCADKCVGKLCEEQLLNEEIEGKRRKICQQDSQCGYGHYCATRETPIAVYDCHGNKNGDCVNKRGELNATSACCVTNEYCKYKFGEGSYCMNYQEPQAEVFYCKRRCGEGQDCDDEK